MPNQQDLALADRREAAEKRGIVGEGTVARKRFWRGNFLFAQDPALGSPGFKRFRPVVREKNGSLRRLTNNEIAKHPQYGDFSLDQTKLSIEAFYDRVEGDELISPLFPGGVSREHRDHVILWWSEVFGGPAEYTQKLGGYHRMVTKHHDLAITPDAHKPAGFRVTNFIRACWAELQRVDWPDRRQVGQATAVVLGFVVVAGAFLGAADVVAQRIVDFIL